MMCGAHMQIFLSLDLHKFIPLQDSTQSSPPPLVKISAFWDNCGKKCSADCFNVQHLCCASKSHMQFCINKMCM